MKWEEIKGQPEAINFLRRSRKKGVTAHAYLFQGPDGVGKALTARVLAQAINCRRGELDPCGECQSCLQTEGMVHPDLFILYPRGKSRTMTIDQLREMQKAAHLNARMGGWKIFILEESDTMSEKAGNSLLKTLEEPPGKTLIILITSRPEKLFATIRSRCQIINFKPWSPDLMKTFLKERSGLEKEEAEVLHHISGGRPGRALKIIEEGFFPTRRFILETLRKRRFASGRELTERVQDWLDRIKERSRSREADLEKKRMSGGGDPDPARMKAWEERDQAILAGENRAELELVFELILSWFRDLYIYQTTGLGGIIINRDQEDVIREESGSWKTKTLLGIMSRVEFSRRAVLDKNAPPQLVFENLFLQLGFWKTGRH